MTARRFGDLWTRCLAPNVASKPEAIFDELVRRYSETHRHYHTRVHIEFCLQRMDMVGNRIEDADAVEMTLWFHDLIYEPQAKDNELQSAERFAELAQGKMSEAFIKKVYDLIMVTTHRHADLRGDDRYVSDIDLSSFGRPWTEFRVDGDAVREEFAEVPDHDFYPAQASFLRSLLERPSFYYSEFFRERYERTARANLQRYLDELGGRGYA